jgi:tetratricopeptide (TPR) repeat protein
MTPGGIRHEPFFAALGKTSEDSARWPSLLAALVTLRLIDEWLAARYAPPEMLAAVQTTLDTIAAADPSRQLVADLLAPVANRETPDFRAVATPLFAYARWLHDGAYWALADDVYSMVWHGLSGRTSASPADLDLASHAALLAGACRRGAGDPNGADAAYAAARALATELGDEVRVRRSELGRAKVAQMRGNLPAAEAALRALIAQTNDPKLVDVRAHAYHDLGVTLFWREDNDGALEAYRQALIHTNAPDERLRVVADIGSVLGELGYVREARIADLLVLKRSDDAELRGAAGVNLIEVARLERNEADFAHFRAVVEKELDTLPTKIQVDFHYGLGLGFETFGDRKQALAEYDLAIEIAEEHGLGQELYKIDCARDALTDGLSNAAAETSPPPLPSVRRLGEALALESAAP